MANKSKVTGSKITTVGLSVKGKSYIVQFAVDHAERILLMPDNGGWFLPSDSKFEFSKEHGIRRK